MSAVLARNGFRFGLFSLTLKFEPVTVAVAPPGSRLLRSGRAIT